MNQRDGEPATSAGWPEQPGPAAPPPGQRTLRPAADRQVRQITEAIHADHTVNRSMGERVPSRGGPTRVARTAGPVL